VAQAVGLLDALGIEQTDLVGNSFGGALALALAIRHPKRVRRLVLMGRSPSLPCFRRRASAGSTPWPAPNKTSAPCRMTR
jgi:pimeloyl-ACP methyl ester carboxylesterase